MTPSSVRMFWLPVLVSLACAVSTVATAEGTQLPAPQQFGSVQVLNGGVTVDEAQAMAGARSSYRLRLVLASPAGEYQVADSIAVTRDGQTLVRIPNAGPQLLLDLPPGSYALELRAGSFMQSRLVTVAAGGTTVRWTLPTPAAAP